MKKTVILILCILMTLSLCACAGRQTEKYVTRTYAENGIEMSVDADPSKTPTIHKGIELFYERDYVGCVEQFILALEKGEFDPIIYHKLGYMYAHGFGVEKNIETSISFYEKGIECGQQGCYYNLGAYYYQHGEELKAKELYEKGIEETGYGLCYYGLAVLYHSGCEGVDPDPAKVEELLQKAYETNDPETVYNVGKFHSIAGKDEEEMKKGIEILEEAGTLGYAEAYVMIGNAYEGGLGVEADPAKAYEYFLKGAEAMRYADFYDNVGYCYEEGVGVEADPVKAKEYYEKATKDGSGMAWYDLGRMYEEGIGTEKDLGKAIECYMNAAKNDFDCPYGESKLKEVLEGLK